MFRYIKLRLFLICTFLLYQKCVGTILQNHNFFKKICYYNIPKIYGKNTITFLTCYCGLLQYFFFVFFQNYLYRFYFFNIELIKNLTF